MSCLLLFVGKPVYWISWNCQRKLPPLRFTSYELWLKFIDDVDPLHYGHKNQPTKPKPLLVVLRYLAEISVAGDGWRATAVAVSAMMMAGVERAVIVSVCDSEVKASKDHAGATLEVPSEELLKRS
ncbi:hypothetical protein Tco_1054263 [Tanacetum coccineum]|uniref:Uncharacterized protein n=1 Tax=Tanacetum coccineum TaxID=301880 RepID=A0ABQ5GWA8_9ASTR